MLSPIHIQPEEIFFNSSKIFYDAQVILKDLVSFDTSSDKSNEKCTRYITDYLQKNGIHFEILKSEDGLQSSILASVGKVDPSSLLFVAHTDCVPVTGQEKEWASEPYQLHIRQNGNLTLFTKEDAQRRADQNDFEGELVARGVTDNKQSVAVLLAMAGYVSKISPDLGFGFRFALTAREETTMEGARLVVEKLCQDKIAPKGIWVLEPTPLVLDHNSSLEFLTEVQGGSCHSSDQAKGVNAIDLAWEFSREVKKIVAKIEEQYPGTIGNIPATINGGTSTNTVPGNCTVSWQARGTPEVSVESLIKKANTCSKKILTRYAHIPGVSIVTKILSDTPAFSQDPNNDFVKLFKEISGQTETKVAEFTTEAGIMKQLGQRLKRNIPVLVYGTKHYETAHAPNESLEIEDLYNLTRDMQKVLIRSKGLSFS